VLAVEPLAIRALAGLFAHRFPLSQSTPIMASQPMGCRNRAQEGPDRPPAEGSQWN
jgi:hypothetical protein